MKHLIILIGLITGIDLNAQEAQESINGAQIKFDTSTYHFGQIAEGDSVSYIYTFENTGNEPLIISKIGVTCGCTQPKTPEKPIMPGEKGEIPVTFNSKGKSGTVNKTITVYSNANESMYYLKLKGEIKSS